MLTKRLCIFGPKGAIQIRYYYYYYYITNIIILKSGLGVTQDHSNRYHSKAWVQFPIRLLCLSADVAAPIKDPAPL